MKPQLGKTWDHDPACFRFQRQLHRPEALETDSRPPHIDHVVFWVLVLLLIVSLFVSADAKAQSLVCTPAGQGREVCVDYDSGASYTLRPNGRNIVIDRNPTPVLPARPRYEYGYAPAGPSYRDAPLPQGRIWYPVTGWETY